VHPLNPRIHPDAQKAALTAILNEIGFARSLLVYETPEGKLQLIDGHLRKELFHDQEVMVEILDVNEQEANALLLSLDPLASLAQFDSPTLEALRKAASTQSETLQKLWDSIDSSTRKTKEELREAMQKKESILKEQFLVLVECESEAQQLSLLDSLKKQQFQCKALLS
jgi:predicted RNA-binding protein with RPS1 domain